MTKCASADKSPTADKNGTDMPAISKSGKSKKSVVSRSAKAGLMWPVSRTHRKAHNASGQGVKRVGAAAPVFIAAVTEFFAAEVLELAGNLCQAMDQQGGPRKRLMPKDILHAIRSDKEINKCTAGIRVLVGDKVRRAETASAIAVTKKPVEAK